MVAVAGFAVAVGAAAQQFVSVKDGHFERGGKPYYYVGTNFWYGAILGSEGQGGDRARLIRELDELKSNGMDNLRILVGSDGERGVKTKLSRASIMTLFSQGSTSSCPRWGNVAWWPFST